MCGAVFPYIIEYSKGSQLKRKWPVVNFQSGIVQRLSFIFLHGLGTWVHDRVTSGVRNSYFIVDNVVWTQRGFIDGWIWTWWPDRSNWSRQCQRNFLAVLGGLLAWLSTDTVSFCLTPEDHPELRIVSNLWKWVFFFQIFQHKICRFREKSRLNRLQRL